MLHDRTDVFPSIGNDVTLPCCIFSPLRTKGYFLQSWWLLSQRLCYFVTRRIVENSSRRRVVSGTLKNEWRILLWKRLWLNNLTKRCQFYRDPRPLGLFLCFSPYETLLVYMSWFFRPCCEVYGMSAFALYSLACCLPSILCFLSNSPLTWAPKSFAVFLDPKQRTNANCSLLIVSCQNYDETQAHVSATCSSIRNVLRIYTGRLL